jgi:hypothetical protein
MTKITIYAGMLIFAVMMSVAFGQSADKKADTLKPEKKATAEVKPAAEPSLVGEWTVIAKDSTYRVGLVVRDDGTYTRQLVDASVTGPYKLDMKQTPYAIDLCVGKCGGPGSEWTTLFCIFRFHTADTLEVRYSPSGERFKEFAEEPDENTVFYLLQKGDK